MGWYVSIIEITTNVIYVKVSVIVAEICTTFKENSNSHSARQNVAQKEGGKFSKYLYL